MTRTSNALPASLPWIERLVAIDTTSRTSNRPLLDLVADEMRRHGLEPRILPDPTGEKANLVVTIPAADGARTGGVMLSGHTDCVPVDGQDWSSDPFSATVRDGRLYGRGVCDMKGWIGVVLHHLPVLCEARLREPIHVALSYDEEPGCLGGAELVRHIADLGLAPRACLVGEPTTMRVVAAHKSMNVVKVTFTGVAAHASLTPKGVNAVEHAARFIVQVREMADAWRTGGPVDDGFDVPWSTASVDLISGGVTNNTVPERCTVHLEFRTIGAVDPQDVIDRLEGFADDVATDMRAENPTARVETEWLAHVPGLDSTPDNAAGALAVRLGATASDEKVAYGTEAGQFAGIGVETVVCGPGDIAQAHTADEYVDLEQIVACETFVARLAEELSVD